MKLMDRRILITGASGGIGSALVATLLDEGAEVLLSGRDHTGLANVVKEHADGNRTTLFAADLTSASDRARLCDFAARWRGGVDILINNAAVNDFALLTSQSAESIDLAMATNLIAPIDLCRRLLPCLGHSTDAHIVNIGSVFGSIGFAGNAVYCATKFGLRGFSESLRRELANTNVRVHYFAPRATRTAFNSQSVDEMNKVLGNASDRPAEVARTIVQALQADQPECVIGWPEKFFARVNALLPRLVDAALAKKLSTIQRFAHRSVPASQPSPAFIDPAAHPRNSI
jgi:short-subunit dehydrogenase